MQDDQKDPGVSKARKPRKRQSSVRLSEEARELVRSCAQELGVSQAAVWEMAIREYVRTREGKHVK